MKTLNSIGNRRNSLCLYVFVQLQIDHYLIFFTLKWVFLLKMEAADGFASISSPKVCKFTLRYSIFYCFQITVKKWGLLGISRLKLSTLYENQFRVSLT